MRRHLLCYDIGDDRRRRRVSKLLDGVGDRVQESVFEADLDAGLFDKVKTRARRLLDVDADCLTAWRLCEACARRREDIGRATGVPRWDEEIVIVV